MKSKRTVFHAVWSIVAVSAFLVGRATMAPPAPTATALSLSPSTPGASLLASKPLASGAERSVKKRPASGPIGDLLQIQTGLLNDRELAAMARDAFKDPNPLKRSLAFAKLLESMTPDNAALIAEQLREFGAEGDDWRMFRYAWGAIDGEGALAAATEIENERYRHGALSSAISGWASADPKKAIDWVGRMEDGDDKNRIQQGLVGGLADNSVAIATDYVLQLAEAGNRRAAGYLEDVASEQLRNSGVEASAQWSERLPDGALKAAAMDRVANAFVDKDPAAAAAWVEQYAQTDWGTRVIEEVGDEWAERKPAEAVAWLDTLPQGAGKNEGMQSALGEWARRDPTAASAYLTEMPASETKDAAIGGFVSRVAWEDPTAAIAWANTIGQDDQRQAALVRAGQAFFRRDREAAAAWLESSGLPVDAQKKVVESGDRRGRG